MLEFNSAKVPRDPPHRAFERLQTIELDPNALTDGRSLDEFDFAAFARRIEHSNAIAPNAGSADASLGGELQSVRASLHTIIELADPQSRACLHL
jgi:hypothetical protein